MADFSPDDLRRHGHDAIEWVARYFEEIERYPVLSRLAPGEFARGLPAAMPDRAESLDAIIADIDRVVMPGVTHWNHPGFFAYFANTASVPGILGELVIAALNQVGILWRTSPALSELEVVTTGWLRDAMGLPADWFGMITDTASVSTLQALAAALVALRKVRFSLLVLPLAGIAVRLIFHVADVWGLNGIGRSGSGWVWVIGASLLVSAAYATDRRQRGDEDFALWLHLAAVFCAVPATFMLLGSTEWYRHFLVPGAFVAFAMALTMRRFPWLLLGMGWFVGYVVWLAADVFKDSPAFPILLAAIGIGVIIATVWVQRNAAMLVRRFGTVTSDGRARFPGGLPLLLAPALVALTMLPAAQREDEEQRRVMQWETRW